MAIESPTKPKRLSHVYKMMLPTCGVCIGVAYVTIPSIGDMGSGHRMSERTIIAVIVSIVNNQIAYKAG